jgi:hypothetical protein
LRFIQFIGLVLLFVSVSNLKSQTDSIDLKIHKKHADSSIVPSKAKTPKVEKLKQPKPITSDTVNKVKEHSPKKAALYSALLPGAGQIYNRKYWKLPIVYGGGIALGYSVAFNHRNFSNFKQELIKRQQNLGGLNPELSFYTDNDLNTFQSFYRRYRDISIAGCLLLYAMNIIDASVDAHLFYFSVSDDLSLRWQPEINPITLQPQLNFTFKF